VARAEGNGGELSAAIGTVTASRGKESQMTDEQDEKNADGRAGRAVAKRGVPRISLEVAEGYAKHLWTVARSGATTEAVLAKQIGGEKAKASGGTWRTKVASLNYWGLIESLPNAQVKLSDIGLRVVRESEPAVVADARRDAVLQVKAYETILKSADGHELPATPGIAGTFHYDFEMNETDAQRAADAFVSSVRRAGITAADGVVRLSDADRGDPDPAPPDEVDGNDDQEPDAPTETEAESAAEAESKSDVRASTKVEKREAPAERIPPADPLVVSRVNPPTSAAAPAVALRVKIDMTEWDADDVVKVLSALGLAGHRDRS
jgi:hypothetical protein